MIRGRVMPWASEAGAVGYRKNARYGKRRMPVGWGTDGAFRGGDLQVAALLAAFRLLCLGKNGDGSPKHPLYVRKDAPLIPWPWTELSRGTSPAHAKKADLGIPHGPAFFASGIREITGFPVVYAG